MRPIRVVYDDHADAFADLTLPSPVGSFAERARAPVVILVHGGFWRDGYFLDLMEPLVPSLVERGWAVWNIEYRRVGAGGGYPTTFVDVAAAVDRLADLPDGLGDGLDLDRVAVVGHSAGGHLAAWLASRSELPDEAVGVSPIVVPKVVVSQAGVLDLVGAAHAGIGDDACRELLGVAPDDVPDRYPVTSPSELLPLGAPVVAIHGTQDDRVPLVQSETYVERATAAGASAELIVIEGADHFDLIDPDHVAWQIVLGALDRHL